MPATEPSEEMPMSDISTYEARLALGLSLSFHIKTTIPTLGETAAKQWDVEADPEDFPAPTWPLPSSAYPNPGERRMITIVNC